jgi:hypothetical protein
MLLSIKILRRNGHKIKFFIHTYSTHFDSVLEHYIVSLRTSLFSGRFID